jgi:tetratricopeptide (TPR) repeat protein
VAATQNLTATQLSDEPTEADLLEFERLARPLAEAVCAAERSTPFTVGIYGEWGSGKTSFLRMLDKRLREKSIAPVWFNAWKYTNEDNIWSALLQTVLTQTPVAGRWYKRAWLHFRVGLKEVNFRRGAWELTRKLAPLVIRIGLLVLAVVLFARAASSLTTTGAKPGTVDQFFSRPLPQLLVALVAFLASNPMSLWKLFDIKLGLDLGTFRRQRDYKSHVAFLDKFDKEFKEILKLVGGGKPLVIVIDDLDRCLPEQTLQILEAVKVLLDVEGCVFFLAVDREIVERAVRVKYKDLPEGDLPRLGETYFDKIVQMPIALPPIHKDTIEKFIHGLTTDPDVRKSAPVLAGAPPFNPRRVKRTLRMFALLRGFDEATEDEERLVPELLAKLVVMETDCRGLYREVLRTPELILDIESMLLGFTLPEGDDQGLADAAARARQYVERYPVLRTLFVQGLDGAPRFKDVILERYIYLLRTVVPTRPEPGTTPLSPSVATNGKVRRLTNLPAIQQGFVGRDEDLQRLKSYVARGRVVLSGLAGSGKTALALKFADSCADEYEVVWWLNAADAATLHLGMEGLADALAIAQSASGPMRPMDLRATVYSRLGALNRSLLIFDGAEDPRGLSEALPSQTNVSIVITSRRTDWGNFARVIAISPLSVEESVELLRSRVPKVDVETARTLSEEVGYLPLALEQAAAYMEETGMAAAQYVSLMQERRSDLLSRGAPADYESSIGAAFAVTLASVERESPEVKELLVFLSVLGNDLVPPELVYVAAPFVPPSLGDVFEDELKLRDVIARLQRFSLLRSTEEGIRIHPLVQSVVRDSASPENLRNWAAVAVRSLEALFPLDPQSVQSWAACAQLVVHALAAARHIPTAAAPSVTARLLDRCSLYLSARGDVSTAMSLLDRSLLLKEADPEAGRLDMAWTEASLGELSLAVGEPGRAVELLESALSAYREADPATPPLSVLSALGSSLVELNEFEKASHLLEPLVSDMDLSSEVDPGVVGVLVALGEVARARGQAVEAEAWMQRAADTALQRFGPEDVRTLGAMCSLGVAASAAGNSREALEVLSGVLAAFEKAYGPDHYQVASVLVNLGAVYSELGLYEPAEEALERAVTISTRLPNPRHPLKGAALAALGNLYRRIGRFDKAVQVLDSAVEPLTSAYGESHPEVVSLRMTLGLSLWESGDVEAAIRWLSAAVDAARRGRQERNHPVLGAALGSLGLVLRDRGRLTESRALFEEAASIAVAAHPRAHPDLAVAHANLGLLLKDMGEAERARAELESALAIAQSLYGRSHPLVATCLNNVGAVLLDLGDVEGASETLRESLSTYRNLLGPSHPDIAAALTNLARADLTAGRNESALRELEEAADISRSVYGASDPRTADAIANLAEVHLRLGRLDTGRALLVEAAGILEAQAGDAERATAIRRKIDALDAGRLS